jgi:glycosyltransferase involved in cell wall biosynthesis
MKILYFSRQYGPHDHRFLSAIVEFGHRAFFLCADPRNLKQDPRSLPDGVELLSGKLPQALAAAQPDLLHAGPLTHCAYEAALSGFKPLVAMSWGSDILYDAQTNFFARRRVRAALKAARALIGDCAAVADAAAGLGFDRSRVVTFPWGIDLAAFSPGASPLRAQLGWQDQFVLLHLRAWEHHYHSETVLRTFLDLAARHPQLRLLMPGGGSQARRFERLIESSGFADRVHLPGKISQAELPAYYRAADLYLSASRSDGSSVSLMEALASGLPALVSDIPGNREWVSEGQQGWLFPVGDAAALAAKIERAMQDRAALHTMSNQARAVAEQRADWSRNKLGLQRAYELAVA